MVARLLELAGARELKQSPGLRWEMAFTVDSIDPIAVEHQPRRPAALNAACRTFQSQNYC